MDLLRFRPLLFALALPLLRLNQRAPQESEFEYETSTLSWVGFAPLAGPARV